MIQNEGKHYLYRHIRLDKNEVFYIGIGTKNDRQNRRISSEYARAYAKSERNNLWYKVANKTPYEIEILLESDDHEFIKQKEQEFITLYGRKDLRKGTLCNLTDGGDGIHNVCQEARDKISKSRIGIKKSAETIKKQVEKMSGENHWTYGKHRTQETKDKIRKTLMGYKHSEEFCKRRSELTKGGAHANAKKIINLQTGVIFGCIREAAESIGMDRKHLNDLLLGRGAKKIPFMYLTDYLDRKLM